jgi:spore maturation protein CgeB
MRGSRLKILYVGPDYHGSNGTCWRDAFAELGQDVVTVDVERLVPGPATIIGKINDKIRSRPASRLIRKLNHVVRCTAKAFKPNFTFYIQGRYILPETLEETRKYGLNFAYMNDDMFNPRNQTFTFFEGIKRMDCILTTKSYNVPEFHAVGASLAIYIPYAYDPKIHYPAEPRSEERIYYEGDVAFIGTFRAERADFLARVAGCKDEFKFNLWGGGWNKMGRPIYWHKRLLWRELQSCLRGGELWCADMGKAIQLNKICLGLLYRANRDLHTSRSFEIPACGGFMLAERTDEHRMYFEEDKEAVYFSSFEEMIDKIRYYLAHEEERRRIADAGYRRCLRSPYRYLDRATFAIEQFHRLR